MGSYAKEIAEATGTLFDNDVLEGQQSFENDYPETAPATDPKTATPPDSAPDEKSEKTKKKISQKKKAEQAPDPEPAKKEKGKLASFYVMSDDYRRYQALAKATGRTLSRFIGDAVADYAKRQKLTPDQQAIYDILMKL